MKQSSNVDITVVDINGKTLFETKEMYFDLGQQKLALKTNNWSQGMYFINLKTKSDDKTVKFIMQ